MGRLALTSLTYSTEALSRLVGPLLGAELDGSYRVHRCVYILSAAGQKFALKLRLKRSGLQSLIARRSFIEEVRVNESLAGIEFEHFRFPRLRGTDGSNWMLFENVEWVDQAVYPPVDFPDMMLSLIEFQSRLYDAQHPTLADRLRLIISSPVVSVLRTSVSQARWIGLRGTLRASRVAISYLLWSRSYSVPLYQHRDLGNPGNLKVDRAGDLYFLDFESARCLAGWPLLDAVDLAFDLESLQFNAVAFADYCGQLGAFIRLEADDVRDQIRVLMMRKSLNLIRYEVWRAAHVKFLMEVLLDDGAYGSWFDIEVRPALEY